MAEDLAALEARLERLRELREGGDRRVKYDEFEAEIKSDGELATAIAALERRIAHARGKPPARVVYINSSKGT